MGASFRFRSLMAERGAHNAAGAGSSPAGTTNMRKVSEHVFTLEHGMVYGNHDQNTIDQFSKPPHPE